LGGRGIEKKDSQRRAEDALRPCVNKN
jgi:hypothetical protein